jgi:hypothetical protein
MRKYQKAYLKSACHLHHLALLPLSRRGALLEPSLEVVSSLPPEYLF